MENEFGPEIITGMEFNLDYSEDKLPKVICPMFDCVYPPTHPGRCDHHILHKRNNYCGNSCSSDPNKNTRCISEEEAVTRKLLNRREE